MTATDWVWVAVAVLLGVPVVLGLGLLRGNARADQIRQQQRPEEDR